ncbi:hypothetical protein BDZ45DRAFT_807036 [Acephala macrosclerotiorum]|nr:hypothetical protein BDZ45DRAFT_807036 [Acephala macrosclerotiorum]
MSWKSFPPELWNEVAAYLPPISLLAAQDSFKFSIDEHRAKHAQIWSTLFRDESWTDLVAQYGLRPTLIGSGLQTLYSGKDTQPTPLTIALILTEAYPRDHKRVCSCRDQLWKSRVLFFASLRSCVQHNKSSWSLLGSKITLYVASEVFRYKGEGGLRLDDPRKLFSRLDSSLSSSLLFWDSVGKYRCQSLGSDHIAGGSGKSADLKDVRNIVAVGLGPWADSHVFIDRLDLSPVSRFKALCSFTQAWYKLPQYFRTTWAREDGVDEDLLFEHDAVGFDWLEEMNPGFVPGSEELHSFQQDFLMLFMDHMPVGVRRQRRLGEYPP